MKVKIFRQGYNSISDNSFENEVNKFCNQHEIINVNAFLDNPRTGMLGMVVLYRD